MHRELYSLEKDNIEKVLKGFIYEFADLYPQIPESEKYTYEFNKSIKEKARENFNDKDIVYFMNWLVTNLGSAEYATDSDRYQFIKKFFKVLDKEFPYS